MDPSQATALNHKLMLCLVSVLIVGVVYLRHPLRRLPGPWYTVFTGLVLTRHTLKGRRLHHIHELHEKYGPVVRVAPDEVDVSDVDGFHRIHKIGGGFLKSPWYSRFRTGGTNVFNAIDPDVHAVRRRALARPFSKTSLRHNWEPFVARKARTIVQKIKQEADGGSADVFKWWTLMTTEVIGKLAFGEEFGMLERGTVSLLPLLCTIFAPQAHSKDLEAVSKGRGIRAETGRFYPIFKAIKSGFTSDFEAIEGRISEFSKTVVFNAHSSDLARTNIFTGILKNDREESERISDHDAVFEAASLMLAGGGTTAVTLTYLVWAVLSHSPVQKRLEDEVAGLHEDFTDAELETLPFLNAVVEEVLRLYGAAPGSLPRTVPEGGLSVKGYYIPPGYTVETQAYTIHRDPLLYHRPDSFLPERWLRKGTEKLTMCAFGAGSRICLGVHLAYMEMRYAVALFFRECRGARLAPSSTSDTMSMEHYFLISPKAKRLNVMLQT